MSHSLDRFTRAGGPEDINNSTLDTTLLICKWIVKIHVFYPRSIVSVCPESSFFVEETVFLQNGYFHRKNRVNLVFGCKMGENGVTRVARVNTFLRND